jgi:hypothetical protein
VKVAASKHVWRLAAGMQIPKFGIVLVLVVERVLGALGFCDAKRSISCEAQTYSKSRMNPKSMWRF